MPSSLHDHQLRPSHGFPSYRHHHNHDVISANRNQAMLVSVDQNPFKGNNKPDTVRSSRNERMPPQQHRFKMVHFSRQIQQYERTEPFLFEEDMHHIWYSQEDYNAIRRDALKLARGIRQSCPCASGIDQAVELATRLADEAYDAEILSHLLQSLPPMKMLCRDPSLRGLERLASRKLNDHVWKNKLLRSKVKLFAKHTDANGIRLIQEQDSRSSVILARWIALSDEVTAAAHTEDIHAVPETLEGSNSYTR